MPDNTTGTMLPFQWIEEPATSRHGEGISRPQAKIRTREFRLIIYPTGAQPMTWITRAETKRHAIKYAEARWPGAAVEVA
jgi:hypothetical protein